MRHQLGLIMVLVALGTIGCTTRSERQAEPSPNRDKPEKRSTDADGTEANDGSGAIACESAEDCQPCATPEDCGCMPWGADSCPPTMHSCVAWPCDYAEAACKEGQCVLLPANGPCKEDEQCEARRDPWGCEYIAVLASARATGAPEACPEVPGPPSVRCDTKKRACVVGDAPSLLTFVAGESSLRWSCETRGVAITKRTYEIDGTTLIVEDNDESKKIELLPADQETLARLLGTSGFGEFLEESPESDLRAPGRTLCDLEITTAEGTTTKSWEVGDAFGDAAEAARSGVASELSRLAKSKAP